MGLGDKKGREWTLGAATRWATEAQSCRLCEVAL